MAGFLPTLLSVSVVVFCICTMLSVGLGHTLREIFGPMLDARGVIRALAANFVLVPLLAYGVSTTFPSLRDAYVTGLMLIATAAGSPLAIKFVAQAEGNVPLAASLTMLLMPATVLYMPFVVPMVVPDARVSPAAIALPLIWTMLLPLGAGLFVRARKPTFAEKVRPWSKHLGQIALVVLLVATVLAHLGGIVRIINEGAIFAPLVVILGAFAIGWAFGREYRGGHVVLAFGAAQRNIAAALVVATQGLDAPDTVVMVVFASLVQFAVLIPIAWTFRWRGRRARRLGHGRGMVRP